MKSQHIELDGQDSLMVQRPIQIVSNEDIILIRHQLSVFTHANADKCYTNTHKHARARTHAHAHTHLLQRSIDLLPCFLIGAKQKADFHH